MDFAFCTLMVVLTATRIDGTKVVVSLPDSEPLAAMANAIKTIANATKQDTNHWKTLKKELDSIKEEAKKSTKNLEIKLKSIEILLNKMMNGSASETESKPRHNSRSTAPEPEPTLPASTEELEFSPLRTVNGEAKSDETYSNSNYHINNAFRINENGDKFCTGYNLVNWYRPFPHLVWYKFPSNHIPSMFSFKRTYWGNSPKTWKFVGSGDEGCDQNSKWVDLCEDLSGHNVNSYEVVSCIVPIHARKPYRCLGIRIYSTPQSSRGKSNEVCFHGIEFWEVK